MSLERGRLGVTLAAGLSLVGLATLGTALSPPSFDPPPLKVDPAYRALPVAPASDVSPPARVAKIRREEIHLDVKDTILAATVMSPSTPGRHPAMVFVHGSGSGTRSEFSVQAEALARNGIVTMIYDKREVGYSFRNRDFGLLADDALTGLRLLRQRSDVDPTRAGLWGVSEGSWVVPIAAARTAEVGFIIMVSAPNVSPLRQVAWALNDQMHRLDAPGGARHMMVKAMGLAGFDYLVHDNGPVLRRVHQPVLAMYGTADPAIPMVESARLLGSSLEQGGNHAYTIRFFGGADHALRIKGADYTPGYLETMATWIRHLPSTSHVQVAGATPVQRHAVSEVPATPWYAGGGMFAMLLLLAGVGYLTAPISTLASRLGRPAGGVTPDNPWPAIRRRLRMLAWSGVGHVVSLNVFVGVAVLLAVHQSGSWVVVQSGWLFVRVLAVLMLVLEVVTMMTVAAAVRDGWRPARGQQLTVVGVIGGTGLLLVAAAYYGLFTFPW